MPKHNYRSEFTIEEKSLLESSQLFGIPNLALIIPQNYHKCHLNLYVFQIENAFMKIMAAPVHGIEELKSLHEEYKENTSKI